jgi:hypothetical protein
MSNEVYKPGWGYWGEVSKLDRALFKRFPKSKLEPDDSLNEWIETSAQVWRQDDGFYRWISHRLRHGMGPALSIVDGIFPVSDDEQFTGRYQVRTASYVPTGLMMILLRAHGLRATTSYIDHMGLDLDAMDTDAINQYFMNPTENPLDTYFTQGPEVPVIGRSAYEFVLGTLRYAHANVFPKNEY